LLGLSIDSHGAWVRNIKERFGVEIAFPIIANLSMQAATGELRLTSNGFHQAPDVEFLGG
jgi:alkyl hydroperoxide reductase subunit AhpC